ncbi:hypothetical protein HDU78_009105 [Chytriomyces hyalinus]|nr:hypothetical protein HDU78_009105 [Chytriomyces hyalinus]
MSSNADHVQSICNKQAPVDLASQENQEFEAFIEKYYLAKYKATLVENEVDTVNSVMMLTESQMDKIGLKVGAQNKIYDAQKKRAADVQTKSNTAATSWSHEVPRSNSSFSDSWVCANGFKEHDVFISYRVYSDNHTAVQLHSSLSTTKKNETPLHVYLDQRCLEDGKGWKDGFLNGLQNSKMVVILLSEEGLKRTARADAEPDNQLLEIELALQRLEEQKHAANPLSLLAVTMWSKVERDTYKKWFPNIAILPDAKHCHPSSPRQLTVQGIFKKLTDLQFVNVSDDGAVSRLVPEVRKQLAKDEKLVSSQLYGSNGSVNINLKEMNALQALLSPIDSASDQVALEKLYVDGTRTWLFDQVADWAKVSDPSNTMLWVNAVAGVGKSVAAAQIANQLDAKAQLVTAVFLKYNDARKSNARRILMTLAYGLSMWYAPFGRKLLQLGLTADNLEEKSIYELFDTLIVYPLKALGQYTPKEAVVIMIDGLDECTTRDTLMALLVSWMQSLKYKAPWLKLLLTSRPEKDIVKAFAGLPSKTVEPSSEENIRDLSIFIQHGLQPFSGLTEQEKGLAVEDLLAVPANDHAEESKTFVWINLILNTVKQQSAAEKVTLQLIQQVNRSARNVNALYALTFAKAKANLEVEYHQHLVTVVSAIATAQTLLTPSMIVELFFHNMEPGAARTVVRKCLSSISIVLDPAAQGIDSSGLLLGDSGVKFNHKSVSDYLLSVQSDMKPLHVASLFHLEFSRRCLDCILQQEVVVNICGIYNWHHQIPDLDKRVAEKISEVLSYSVLYWITHFLLGASAMDECPAGFENVLVSELCYASMEKLFKTHIFYWMECTSLKGEIKRVLQQIGMLRKWARNRAGVCNETKSLISDCYRFLREFADPIIKSAPQTYYSGFTFCPKETALYKAYANALSGVVPFDATPLEPTWGACEMTLDGHASRVTSVAVSEDGAWMVSGSHDNSVKVWDMTTGAVRYTLEGHSETVTSVAVSSDCAWILSGSMDNTVKVWDIMTGEIRCTLEGHSGGVLSVAVSSDCAWILSGSLDNTVKVWDMATGAVKHTLKGHTDLVNSVAVSNDCAWIVSGSMDKTVKVWDMSTGAVKHTLEGHTDLVTSVTVSSDCVWIVSGSYDNTVKVWDMKTGSLRHILEGHTDWVESVAVSADCVWVVSGSCDQTVKVWDLMTGTTRHTLDGHTDWVSSVAVSSDGAWIVSGSRDSSVKVWDVTENPLSCTLKGHTSEVMSLAVSNDCTWIVSGSCDNSVKVWDMKTGSLRHTLEGHSADVNSVAVSRDCAWIVSGSSDKKVKVWNMKTGAVRHTMEGHTGGVLSVAVSHDCAWIVSGSMDNTVKVWDMMTDLFPKADRKNKLPDPNHLHANAPDANHLHANAPEASHATANATDAHPPATAAAKVRVDHVSLARKEFDAFIVTYNLHSCKATLLDNEFTTVNSILLLTDDQMKEMGLKLGAQNKIRYAQKDHAAAPAQKEYAAGHVQTISNITAESTNHLLETPYNTPFYSESWACSNGHKNHDVFISYCVSSEKHTAVNLHSALSTTKLNETPLHIYLDQRCLENGKSWENGFLNGLRNSKLVVLLLSEEGLKQTTKADIVADNQLLEIELAFEHLNDLQNPTNLLSIFPVNLWSKVEGGLYKNWFPNINAFPDVKHSHPSSPGQFTVCEIFKKLTDIQFADAVDERALSRKAHK